jgi:hypothetical protein
MLNLIMVIMARYNIMYGIKKYECTVKLSTNICKLVGNSRYERCKIRRGI